MKLLYTIFTVLFNSLLPVLGLLSPKLKLFAKGRTEVFQKLEDDIGDNDRTIWFHCASLGEYEQGVPVMKEIKSAYPLHKIVVTFFSPSGYEVKKNSDLADSVVYLPMDINTNVKRFLSAVHPEVAVFVKYEFWPNYFRQLEQQSIPIVMVSAAFRKEQSFFRWYGGFMRKALDRVTHFFVQDAISKELLTTIGKTNVTISGDTRFDRVASQIEMDNHVDFIANFIGDRLCVVLGSTWPEDETVFIEYVNAAPKEVCFIIAPHEIKERYVHGIEEKITIPTVRYSTKAGKELQEYSVFIMDTVGYLSRVYHYADIAYVGGAMGTSGLHNILEPATFGVPIIIGQHFEKFREAKQLQKLAGLFSVATPDEFSGILTKLVGHQEFRRQTGMIAGHFINSNTGATATIVAYLKTKI